MRDRLVRAAHAIDAAKVPFAVSGEQAAAYWIGREDASAVRNSPEIELLIRRSDLDAAKTALEGAGFVYRRVAGMDMFLDGEDAKPRDAAHIVFANEKVRPHETESNPDVTESEQTPQFTVLSLEAIVRIKLTAFRDKDRTHLRDLIEVGLVDASWLGKLPRELAERLKQLLETPEG